MKVYIILIMATAAIIGACGANDLNSNLADVSGPKNGGGSEILLWQQGDVIYYGNCVAGRLAIRANCQPATNMERQKLVMATVNAYRKEATPLSLKLSEEIDRLKLADPTSLDHLEAIAALESTSTRLTEKKSALVKRLDMISPQIAELNSQIGDYESQITAVRELLTQNPNDAELKLLLRQLTDEKNLLQGELTEFNEEKRELDAEISQKSLTIGELADQLVVKRNEYQRHYDDLVVESEWSRRLTEKINQIEAQTSLIPDVMSLIGVADISYRSSNLNVELREVFGKIAETLRQPQIRLLGPNRILQVFHNSEWLGVCDDSFDAQDGQVACRELGLSYSSFRTNISGESSRFWLDNLNCKGSESRLSDCSHAGWGQEDCNSTEHVSLTCQ